jgi:dTDP-4-dehydrorhamnose 3,5-epimerase
MLEIDETAIPDVKVIVTKAFGDERGYFSESFNERRFAEFGLWHKFVQDSVSLSRPKHTLRGMHFQVPPVAQVKLVRCLAGAVLDVAVDIRHGSPTYGEHVAIELSAENRRQLLIPYGFAHGFLTLTPDTEIAYKQSDYYAPEHERVLGYDRAGVDWQIEPAKLIVAQKDQGNPSLDDLPIFFRYGAQ